MAEIKILSPLKAMRQNCMSCMGGSKDRKIFKAVRDCTTRDCPLWPYRFGMGYKAAFRQGKDVIP